jgi:hypothetical protein
LDAGRQGRDVEEQDEGDRDDAERADVALLHDPKHGLAVPAAAEGVREVGQAVQMQRAGEYDEDQYAEHRRQQSRIRPQQLNQRDNPGRDPTKHKPDNRRQHHRPPAHHPIHPRRHPRRQHTQQPNRQPHRIHPPTMARDAGSALA